MASVSLSELLDEAIGTPEVNVNLEALRKLLKIMLGHLRLLGLQDVIPQEEEEALEAVAAPTAPIPEQSQAAGPGPQEEEEEALEAVPAPAAPIPEQSQAAGPGPQEEEGGTGTEAGEGGTEQPSQLPGKDELQGTRSGSPVTSVPADMEKTEAKATALSQEPHEEIAGIKAMQSNMGEEIQKIKEALGQTTDLCKDLREEISEMKATQSRMGEGIQTIQEALGQGNLQDAASQPPVLCDQPAPAVPHTSDMDNLGQTPGTQSTTPGMQTGSPSAQSGTTGTQPGSPADHPAMESIIRDLSELQGQMSSLQSLATDLQGEKEKIRQLEDALGKLDMTVAKSEVDGATQVPLQLESALQEIKQEQTELRKEQKITKATLKQLVTADQFEERLNELRTVMRSVGLQQEESQAVGTDSSLESKLVRKLLHRCERLQQQVDSLMPLQLQKSLPDKTQDEELLKSIQATVVRVEGDCEQLSYVTGSLRDDHRQHQKDIEALFRSLEGLEKKADKEELVLLKVDKAALGSKVNCAHFDAIMERLEDRMRDLLRRVLGQEQRWQEAQQRFSEALDSKLDRLELGPFQKKLEESWARIIQDLKKELSVKIDNAAGFKQQLLVPYKCLSCDKRLNTQVPGPHIDALPLFPSLPRSHAAHTSTITPEEKAQQQGHRKLVNSKYLKSHSCKGQSSAPVKNVLHLSKKPGVTELLGTDDHMDCSQEHRPEVAKKAQDELGPTTLGGHQPASDLKH